MTGATGFIGKQILLALLEAGHAVLALIRPGRHGANTRLAMLGIPREAPVQAVSADLSLPDLGLSAADRASCLTAEIIIHAGAPMDLTLTPEQAEAHILGAADRLFELATEINALGRPVRFVHLCGYMSPITDASTPVAAPAGFMPHAAPYERAKFLADLRVRQAARRTGVSLTVVHPSTVIGHSQTGETEQLTGLGLVVDAVRRGLMRAVPGGTDHWLPLVAVDDVARLTAAVAVKPDAAGKTYYALDRESPRIGELLRMIAHELRVGPPLFSVPVPLVQSILRAGLGKLAGLMPESLDFITARQFPGAIASVPTRSLLPSVICDLDYRLGRQGTPAPDARLERLRLGQLAALRRQGSGTPWVILHGLFSNADELIPLATAMPEGPVYLIDLPGFGRSPLPAPGGDWLERQARAVAEALGQIAGPVHLAGHSFGALVAAKVAANIPQQVIDLHFLQPPLQRPRLPGLLAAATAYPWLTRSLLRYGMTVSRLAAGFGSPGEMPPGYAERVMADMRSPRIRHATAESCAVMAGGPVTIHRPS